ncbi:MAG: hypothetical protein JHC31_13950 [Sulfurihydrogenibium sp.]|jgi:hypothetical protein|nr:hypothetical protein [Sulfurihydrogenibium sp.]
MITEKDFLKGVIKVDFDEFRKLIEKANKSVEDAGKRDMFDEPLIYFQFCPNESVLKIKVFDTEKLSEIGSVSAIESETSVVGEYRDISASDVQKIHKFVNKFIVDDGNTCILDGTAYLFFSIRKMIVNIDDECLVIY